MAGTLKWQPEPMGKYGRHFVGGKPVHCGDLLELQLDDGSWTIGRYEWNPAAGGKPALHFGSTSVFLTDESFVRWPKPNSSAA